MQQHIRTQSACAMHLCSQALHTIFFLVLQYLVGLYAYLFPKMAIRNRRALGPIHQFTGRAAFTAGLATMAVSTQQLLVSPFVSQSVTFIWLGWQGIASK